MRALLAATLAIALVVTTLPAEAREGHLFPKTEKATRELVGTVLVDVDTTNAKMLRMAQKMVRIAKKAGEGAGATLPEIPTPTLPDTRIGAIEVRASLVQPGVRGIDQMVGALWLGASQGHWTGAYWVESDGMGYAVPSLLDMDETGIIMYVDGGALAQSDAYNVTYHFLGIDGTYTTHALGQIQMLPAMPVLDRADIGGAHASAHGGDFEALLITPWNLHDHNVTMGMTFYALDGTEILDDIIVAGCEDFEATQTEPGCRLLYILPFTDDIGHVDVWHLDGESGERVLDRGLTRAQMLAGFTLSQLA